MSIQRFNATTPRPMDPASTARGANNNARSQSPFWQVFTAGGNTPPVNQRAAGVARPAPPQAAPQAGLAPAKTLTPVRTTSAMVRSAVRSTPAPVAAPARLSQTAATAPDPLAAVRAALEQLGLNPQQFNLRIDQNPIRFADRQFDYPLLRADLPNESVGFHLESVIRDPMMTAMNISGMMGRPVMNIPQVS